MTREYIGIDVSDNQGIIDWAKVKRAGVEFAILRSVRRSGKADNQFDRNVKGCRAEKIPIAVYKYTYATNEKLAEQEAKQVLELLQQYNLKCKIFWDVEDGAILQELGKEKLTKCIEAAQKVIESAGYEFHLYTGLYVYNERWFDFNRFLSKPWIARYPSSSSKTLAQRPDNKYFPNVGRDIIGWQWSSKGQVDGISGNVDLDLLYINPKELEYTGNENSDKKYMLIAEGNSQDQFKNIQQELSDMGIKNVICQSI